MIAFPKKSPEEIWTTIIRPAFDRGTEKGAEKVRKGKATKPETGKGSKSGEPVPSEGTPEGFEKWPLEKRREWFKKKGVV